MGLEIRTSDLAGEEGVEGMARPCLGTTVDVRESENGCGKLEGGRKGREC